MRISVDRATCEGLGMCESMAPDFFEVTDDPSTGSGQATAVEILNETPDAADRDQVHSAVESCPVLALTLHE